MNLNEEFKSPLSLVQLIRLNIHHIMVRDLKFLPNEVGLLENLQVLDISKNHLSELPNSLAQLSRLISLNASMNNFHHVPEVVIKGLSNLTYLNLSWNWLQCFERTPSCLAALQQVDISHNLLSHIPLWLFHPTCAVKSINLEGNNFNYQIQPLESGRVNKTLKCFNLRSCSISNSEFAKALVELEELNLGNIVTKSMFVGSNTGEFEPNHLKNVKKLILANLFLSILPKNFGDCVSLTYLDLSKNDLSFLPHSFKNLVNLKTLIVSDNSLIALPSNFSEFTFLHTLKADGNRLEDLPAEMCTMKSLKVVDLYDNLLMDVSTFKEMVLDAIDLECNYLVENEIDGYVSKLKRLRGTFGVVERIYGQKEPPSASQSNSYSGSSSLLEDDSHNLHDDGDLDADIASNCDNSNQFNDDWDADADETTYIKSKEELLNDHFDPYLFRSWTLHATSAPRPTFNYLNVIVEGQFDDA